MQTQVGEQAMNVDVEGETETQVEMVVQMETIEMIHLQEHYCELLQQIAEQVTLLPLTQPHAAGFKASLGDCNAFVACSVTGYIYYFRKLYTNLFINIC